MILLHTMNGFIIFNNMKNVKKPKNLPTQSKTTDTLLINHDEISPIDREIVENVNKEIKDCITNFVNNSTVILRDFNYSSITTWEYPLSKNIEILFLLAHKEVEYDRFYGGYYGRNLIIQKVQGQISKPAVALGRCDTPNRAFAQSRINEFFLSKQKIMAFIEAHYQLAYYEIEAISKIETGEELKSQLNNVKWGFTDKINNITLTDTWNYQEWH